MHVKSLQLSSTHNEHTLQLHVTECCAHKKLVAGAHTFSTFEYSWLIWTYMHKLDCIMCMSNFCLSYVKWTVLNFCLYSQNNIPKVASIPIFTTFGHISTANWNAHRCQLCYLFQVGETVVREWECTRHLVCVCYIGDLTWQGLNLKQ